ncbi:antibiotic biosynthesis monooxygenase [Pedobacter gandavensis]|uniref:antibiotic biosynthesis monooxygenase family protein n=1 Tax=Pedobacter gandavensis TaxID=2679963 RepID=UPI002930E675|nr:antibiotic biosynthesis monooxygenase [Pedobacter gandavensis]
MILEAAFLYIKKGQGNEFEKDFIQAGQYIRSISGYIRHSLQKCLEQDDKYLLLVEWQELEDHTIGFRQSEAYTHWRELLHHYYDPFPIVEHFHSVIDSKDN